MFGLKPIDYVKLNKYKLAEIYNCSDIEAIEYMYPFCEGELKELCERIHTLNMETDIGYGREPATEDEDTEYQEGKWKLLNHFGVLKDNDGSAYVKENEEVANKGFLYKLLKEHAGHRVEIAEYGDGVNFALEDMDTNEVIFDTDCYDLVAIDSSDEK